MRPCQTYSYPDCQFRRSSGIHYLFEQIKWLISCRFSRHPILRQKNEVSQIDTQIIPKKIISHFTPPKVSHFAAGLNLEVEKNIQTSR